jgi:DNA-binding response OmpR family regulator
MDTTKTVLVVEDCIVSGLLVGRIMEQALPGCRIMRAQTCHEARLLMRLYNFSLLVLDVHLPDGCGLDLIPKVLRKNAAADFIVLTADPQPEFRQRSRTFGVKHFLTKPFSASALGDAARNLCHDARENSTSPQAANFTASLRQLSLIDVLQLKCLTGASTRLQIANAEPEFRHGHLDIERGEIVNAELQDKALGHIAQGEDALTEMLGWQGGTVVENRLPPLARRTIEQRWQSLLLSAAQKADELAAERRLGRN